MAQDQKRNPRRREEGTKLRTVVGENETPKDPKTLRSEGTEEHSCILGLLRDEPGVGAPSRSHQRSIKSGVKTKLQPEFQATQYDGRAQWKHSPRHRTFPSAAGSGAGYLTPWPSSGLSNPPLRF